MLASLHLVVGRKFFIKRIVSAVSPSFALYSKVALKPKLVIMKLDTPLFKEMFTPETHLLSSMFKKYGYDIRIAGGAVRDILLNKKPMDIDFATTATPEEMRKMFTEEGGVHLPKSSSARILVSFWWMFVMIVMATYSGNLIAFLTVPEIDWKVKSLDDLARDRSIVIYLKRGSPLHAEISHEVTTETLKLLQKRFDESINAELIGSEDVLPNIIKGKAALIEDIYVLYDIINTAYQSTEQCDLAIVPDLFLEIYVAIAGRKGCPYMKDINRLMRSLWNGGMMQYWAANFSELRKECNIMTNYNPHGDRKDVTLNDLQGVFYSLFIGLVVSVVTALAEITWRKWKGRRTAKRKRTKKKKRKKEKKQKNFKKFYFPHNRITIYGDHDYCQKHKQFKIRNFENHFSSHHL